MRCFIAIDIPYEAKEIIKEIHTIIKDKNIKQVETENVHITIKFLGEIDDVTLKKVDNTLKTIIFKKFDVSIKKPRYFSNRGNPTVFFLDIFSEKLKELASIVEEKLYKIGIPKESRDFKPHLTLARVKGIIDKNITKNFLSYKTKDITFTVDKISLYESRLTPAGPIYKLISSYNLYE